MGCGSSTCGDFKNGCCCKSCKNSWINWGRPCDDYFKSCKCAACKNMESQMGDSERKGLAGNGTDSCKDFKKGCVCKACQSIWSLWGRPCDDYFKECKCAACKSMAEGMKDEERKGLSGKGNDVRK